MASRKRTEHIERTRYPNPLPPPSYPPKLLNIPTPTSRYADPRNLGMRLAQAHPIPMVVDAEAGMPLNMTDFPQAWYTDQELEAGDDVFPSLAPDTEIDEEDAFLLSDLSAKLPSSSNGAVNGANGRAVVDRGNVTWLRRTEYLGAEQAKRRIESMANKGTREVIDSSRQAQVARIKASFMAANVPLSEIQHPTKPGVKAIDSYSVLPDTDTWATRFDVFRFGDLPGRVVGGKAKQDPRLEVALLRPHQDVLDESIFSLFLVSRPEEALEEDEDGNLRPRKRANVRTVEEDLLAEDAEAARIVKSRAVGEQRDGMGQQEETDDFDVTATADDTARFAYVRDYQPHDETNRKDQELIFTFVDNPSSVAKDASASPSQSGCLPPVVDFERSFRKRGSDERQERQDDSVQKIAYYHPVSSRAQLRVRRRKVNDPRPIDHWDAIINSKRSISRYEKIERLYERMAVDDFGEGDLPERITLPAYEEEEIAVEEDSTTPMDEALDGEAQERKDEHSVALRERAADDDDEDKGEDEGVVARKARRPASPTGHSVADGPARQLLKSSGGDDNDADDGSGAEDEGDNESVSGSGSEGENESDGDVDDDELAALRAEAGDDADMDGAQEEDEGGPRSRRSRRAVAAAAAFEENEAFREQQRARNAELGGDDEDEE